MTVYTRQGGLFEAETATGTKCIEVLKIERKVRTEQMVAEYRHWRATHTLELLPGALELLKAWKSLDELKASSAKELKEERKLKAYALYDAEVNRRSISAQLKSNRALEEEVRKLKRELKEVKTQWAPAFVMESIPIFLLDYNGALEGARPQGAGVSLERQQTYLAKKATFKPDPELAKVGYYCHKSKRVAWQLNNGLIVVDDFGPSLAVHVVSSLELAKSMVSKAITIAEAKKSQHHLARIEHSEGYETSVLETLKEHAA
jgi:hypothetical protein